MRRPEFRDRIGTALDGPPIPAFAMVLIGPMLWACFEHTRTMLEMAAHIPGPISEDVVIVTDEPVVAALLDGRITPYGARKPGLVRFFGAQENVEVIALLIDRSAPVMSARNDH